MTLNMTFGTTSLLLFSSCFRENTVDKKSSTVFCGVPMSSDVLKFKSMMIKSASFSFSGMEC